MDSQAPLDAVRCTEHKVWGVEEAPPIPPHPGRPQPPGTSASPVLVVPMAVSVTMVPPQAVEVAVAVVPVWGMAVVMLVVVAAGAACCLLLLLLLLVPGVLANPWSPTLGGGRAVAEAVLVHRSLHGGVELLHLGDGLAHLLLNSSFD